jgi:hypothetical protein
MCIADQGQPICVLIISHYLLAYTGGRLTYFEISVFMEHGIITIIIDCMTLANLQATAYIPVLFLEALHGTAQLRMDA